MRATTEAPCASAYFSSPLPAGRETKQLDLRVFEHTSSSPGARLMVQGDRRNWSRHLTSKRRHVCRPFLTLIEGMEKLSLPHELEGHILEIDATWNKKHWHRVPSFVCQCLHSLSVRQQARQVKWRHLPCK